MVVEVFITHILKSALTSMNPPTNDFPLPPTYWRIVSAIRRCKFQRCIAKATIKPQKKRYITLLANGVAASCIEEIPRRGKKTSGNSAVIAMGMASVAHQIAINTPIAATLHA